MKRPLALTTMMSILASRRTAFVGSFVTPATKTRFGSRLLGVSRSTPTAEQPSGASASLPSPSKKVNLLSLSLGELETLLVSWGQPKFRAKQVWAFVADKGVRSFDEMSNLPKALRVQLSEHLSIGSLSVAIEQVSKDGTRKRAYVLDDGQLVESVLMPYNDGRRTACISSQAGCGMGCTFCATGQMGFVRHLTATEIFEQAQTFAAELKALPSGSERLSNVVMMGMGEPLANYDNVLEAARRINSELGVGARHITISTVGLAPRIRQLAREPQQFTLAVSLHEAVDEARSAIMPVNRRYPIAELMDACREYVDVTGRRISFEWALIAGKNDSPEVAERLGKLLRPLRGKCHVNIIPLNPTGGFDGRPGDSRALAEFVKVLDRKHGVPASARVRRGIDIDAGCGQLTQTRKKRMEKEAEAAAKKKEKEVAAAAAAATAATIEPPEPPAAAAAAAAAAARVQWEGVQEE